MCTQSKHSEEQPCHQRSQDAELSKRESAGSQFALPSFTGLPDSGTAVRWQTIFGTAPTAVNLVLQGAMADIDAEYQTIDTTTATTGEARTVASVQAKFLRIKFVSSTGGTGLTAKLMV